MSTGKPQLTRGAPQKGDRSIFQSTPDLSPGFQRPILPNICNRPEVPCS